MNIYFLTSTLTQQSLKIFFNDMRMYEDGIVCRYGRLILNYVIVDFVLFMHIVISLFITE